MSDKNHCYSLDGEDFRFDTAEEAIASALEEGITPSFINTIKIYRGEKTPRTVKNYLNIENILEDLIVHACDDVGESADTWLDFVDAKRYKEEFEELGNLISGWFDKHMLQPQFFGVENVQKMCVSIGKGRKR